VPARGWTLRCEKPETSTVDMDDSERFVIELVLKRRAMTDKHTVTDKRNIVTAIENDGDYIDAQFVRENGEIVIGIYKRIGWHSAPKAERDGTNERTGLPQTLLMTDRRNIVTAIENDGDHISAQFVRENGELVVGIYKRFGWDTAPKAVRDDINERLRLPPLTIVYTQRR
jgi:Cu/Ag efflux protein CusF